MTPVTRLIPKDELLAVAPNTVSFEKYPELQRRLFELMSLAVAGEQTEGALGSLLCCLPHFEMPAELGYDKVFRVLTVAGLDMEQAEIITPGTTDERVLWKLSKNPAEVFLIPFHAHRDTAGQLVNGLALVLRLDRELPELRRIPILMPISTMGMSAAEVMLSRGPEHGGLTDEVRGRILFIPEATLDDDTLPARVREHVSAS